MAKVTLKVSGRPQDVKAVLEFFPTELVEQISETMQCGNDPRNKFKYIHLDANFLKDYKLSKKTDPEWKIIADTLEALKRKIPKGPSLVSPAEFIFESPEAIESFKKMLETIDDPAIKTRLDFFINNQDKPHD